MANYSGKEKVSLSNVKELWQYIIGGGAQVIRKAMGLGDTLGPLPVENGGTGSSNAVIDLKRLFTYDLSGYNAEGPFTESLDAGLYMFVWTYVYERKTNFTSYSTLLFPTNMDGIEVVSNVVPKQNVDDSVSIFGTGDVRTDIVRLTKSKTFFCQYGVSNAPDKTRIKYVQDWVYGGYPLTCFKIDGLLNIS